MARRGIAEPTGTSSRGTDRRASPVPRLSDERGKNGLTRAVRLLLCMRTLSGVNALAKDKARSSDEIGDVLRRQRTEVLGKGLREMARHLGTAPAHLTDIEHGNRSPSETLLVKIARAYEIPEAQLRAAWSKPDEIVEEIASQDATAAAKVPELLRSARKFTERQWNALIEAAKKLASEKKGKAD